MHKDIVPGNTSALEELKNELRARREVECFPFINRGKFYYDFLSIEQLAEFRTWYYKWLDVTETLIVPEPPIWLTHKLIMEDII